MVVPIAAGSFLSGAGGLSGVSSLITSLFGNGRENTDTDGATSGTNASRGVRGSDTNRRGNTSRAGTTSNTSRTRVDQAAVDRAMQQVLEGTDGLASIMGAEQNAGGFNSSTAALLTNDLMSRVAGEVARLNTTTTSEGDNTQQEDTASTDGTFERTFQDSDFQTRNYQHGSGGGSSGAGCFITTAVCVATGKGDNCRELAAFRKFRDTWVKQYNPEIVKAYYNIAPSIVTYIDSLPNSGQIYRNIYRMFLAPCYRYLQAGSSVKAYELYAKMFIALLVYKVAATTK